MLYGENKMRTIEPKPLYESEIEMADAICRHLERAAEVYLRDPEDHENQQYLYRAGASYDAVSESGTDWSELARLARGVRLYGASDAEKIREQLEYVLELDF